MTDETATVLEMESTTNSEREGQEPEVWLSPRQAFVWLSEKLPPQDFTTSEMTFYSWIKKGAIPGTVLMGPEGRGARIWLPLSGVRQFNKKKVPRKRSGRPAEPNAPYSKHKHLAGLDIA
jgi:hypothetical protein